MRQDQLVLPAWFDRFIPVLYVQISPELLCIRNVRTGQSICEVPELALSEGPKPQVLGIGAQARLAAQGRAAKVVNPFAHPRSLISDFTVSELLLKTFVRGGS